MTGLFVKLFGLKVVTEVVCWHLRIWQFFDQKYTVFFVGIVINGIGFLYAFSTTEFRLLLKSQPFLRLMWLPSEPVKWISNFFVAKMAFVLMTLGNLNELCLPNCDFSLMKVVFFEEVFEFIDSFRVLFISYDLKFTTGANGVMFVFSFEEKSKSQELLFSQHFYQLLLVKIILKELNIPILFLFRIGLIMVFIIVVPFEQFFHSKYLVVYYFSLEMQFSQTQLTFMDYRFFIVYYCR